MTITVKVTWLDDKTDEFEMDNEPRVTQEGGFLYGTIKGEIIVFGDFRYLRYKFNHIPQDGPVDL